MKEIQTFSKKFQEDMKFQIKTENYATSKASLLNNYMLLTTEVAEVAEELRKTFNTTDRLIHQGLDEKEAFLMAKDIITDDLGRELSDCLAYILKFANYFNIDLEQSFYEKMEEVKNRPNKDIILAHKSLEF